VEDIRTSFLAQARAAFGEEESRRVESALDWMIGRLEGRHRASGEESWEHDLRVAGTLLLLGMDADSVVAGLLHDALEKRPDREAGDAEAEEAPARGAASAAGVAGGAGAAPPAQPAPPEGAAAAPAGARKKGRSVAAEKAKAREAASRALRSDIALRFGPGVSLLVEDVSRLAALKAKNKTVHAAETIRKMLFAMARDIRVIIVKLADKLDSMRTLRALPEEKQKAIAAECLDIFAPLADRLGISWMKDELEDLSLKALNREAFDQIKEIVAAKKGERESFLQRVESEIREAARAEGIELEISARAKHFYSIYRKMRRKARGAEELFDLLGLRLICAGENECYALLGLVHRLWKPMEGRFKDYIAMPKANGYKSLHTTVMCYEGRLLEVQIRTRDMHRVAEFGVASHWLYKKGTAAESPRPEDLPIVNRLKEWSDFVSQGAVFLDEIKRELLKDSIFVFTPRGDVIELPAGATPLDFAFAIHTDVGIHCVGAKADGQIVHLDSELRNTQVVEIMTAPSARPNMNWLHIARTSKARAKIRAWLVQEGEVLAFDRDIVAGKRAAEQAQQQPPPPPMAGLDASKGSIEFRNYVPGEALRNERAGVSIGGAKNMMIRIAGCCGPVTGDDIVGYISRGRGIIVHRADCRSIRAVADFAERRIDVRWEASVPVVTARFRLTARKSPDLFSEIEAAVRKFRGRLREGRLGDRGDGTLSGSFTMEVETREDVKRVVKAVRSVPAVLSLEEDD